MFSGFHTWLRKNHHLSYSTRTSAEMTSMLASAPKTVEGMNGMTGARLRPCGSCVIGVTSVLVDGSTVLRTELIRKELLDMESTIVEPVGELPRLGREAAHEIHERSGRYVKSGRSIHTKSAILRTSWVIRFLSIEGGRWRRIRRNPLGLASHPARIDDPSTCLQRFEDELPCRS